MSSTLKRLPSSNAAVIIVIATALFLIASFSIGFLALLSHTDVAESPLPPHQPQPSSLSVKNGNWSYQNDANVFEENSTQQTNDSRKQYIRPIKVVPPWTMNFEENLLSEKNRSGVFRHPHAHHSGNFRRNKATVWDPHPEYEFYAFDQLFHLILEHDSKFAHPSLKVTVVSKNFTIQRDPDVNPSGCYYSGFLRNQSNSKVVVSLCNGMTGHIKSENGSYFVQPVEAFDENKDTFLHILYRLDSDSDSDPDSDSNSNSDSDSDKNSDSSLDSDYGSNADDSRYLIASNYTDKPTHCELLENSTFHGDINSAGCKNHSDYDVISKTTSNNNSEEDSDDDDSEDDDDEDETDEENNGDGSSSDIYTENMRTISNPMFGRRRKRSTAAESVENIVELMIAIDKGMAQYHGSGLHNYILTLMSMVNKIYKDKSIGNPIHITVVKLMILSDHDIINTKLSNEETALPETLENFCKWQHDNNNNNDLNPSHHDCALLLSREITCKLRNVDKCYDKLGLAQLGTMCQKNCCAIIRDNGLSTAFTIAHELGHAFNMPHDEDEKCVRFIEKGIKKRVMSKQLGTDTHPWKWSACSRHFLTEFLDMGNDVCLHDDPFSDYFKISDVPDAQQLPGEKYSKDRQCEMIYGKGFKSCWYMNNCSSLWCWGDEKANGCLSNGMPPAEGTSCGRSHWCQQGECVHMDRTALNPLDGGWGPWQPFGECSRSCGGGIKRAYRNCDNPSPKNGGKFCLGKRVKYQSCNFKECPIGTLDFRSQQCAKFNNNTFDIRNLSRNVRWVPHYYGIRNEKCKLYCRAENTPSYYKLQDKVIDGTACGSNTYDMCVNGVCMKAGCDHILNSNSILDSCGICGGDNSTCRKVNKRFSISRVKFGYNQVIIIPAGASNIDIQQRSMDYSKDDNYLALVDVESSQYVLNGNFSIMLFPKEIDYDGVAINYSGANVSVERINTSQPLRKDLLLQVLCVGTLNVPQIDCEYTIPISPQDYFFWSITDKWSACDKVCEGEQQKSIRCTRKDTGNYVSEESCSGLLKPKAQIKACNRHCVLRWNMISQSECSSICGQGFRSVIFGCFQEFTDNIFPRVQLPDVSCRHIEKPSENQTCSGTCDTYRWKYDEWCKCNATCGNGVQVRKATCVDEFQRIVDDDKCALSEKIVEKLCIMQKCSIWSTGEWSECSVSCGIGHKTRQVRCLQGNRLVHAYLCAHDKKPAHTETCEMPACTAKIASEATAAKWVAGPWSECSTSCGIGHRSRMVQCTSSDETLCANLPAKPATSQVCMMSECSTTAIQQTNEIIEQNEHRSIAQFATFEWIAGDWESCSSSCGKGEKKRSVRCRNVKSQMFVDDSKCDSSDMPIKSESCFQGACIMATADWKTTEWSLCSSSCGPGVKVRNVWCEMNAIQVDEQNCFRVVKPDKTVQCDTTKNCRANSDVFPTDRPLLSLPQSQPPLTTMTTTTTTMTTLSYPAWRTGKWGECSRSCGVGLKIRHVVCHDENGNEASDCDFKTRPPDTMTCYTESCEDPSTLPLSSPPLPPPSISYRWAISEWTTCSVTCGNGIQKRTLQCERVMPATTQMETSGAVQSDPLIVSNDFCNNASRPMIQLEQECRLNVCSTSDYIWVPEAWGECDASCGGKGRQKRKLACFHRSGRKVKKSFCRYKRKPARRRKCILNKCEPSTCAQVKRKFKSSVDREYPLSILGRNISIYCHRMWSDSPVEYLSLSADGDNYSEFSARKETSTNGANSNACPEPVAAADETSAAVKKTWCAACLERSTVERGRTSFQKIRIDVSTLEVNARDFTFSRQVFGSPVPFGEAADCYSKSMACARGTFSINLKGTGLRVSPSTKWMKSGDNASMKIDFLHENRKVIAKCGGFCASCRPMAALKLDILPP